MNPPELPEDLAELERRLAARPRPEPSDDLRRRVMDAVRAELAGASAIPLKTPRRLSTWEFAAAVAAAVVLALNLAVSGANDMDWTGSESESLTPDPATVAALRQLMPGLTDDEVRGRWLLMQAGRHLVMAPPPPPSPAVPASYEELLAPRCIPARQSAKS